MFIIIAGGQAIFDRRIVKLLTFRYLVSVITTIGSLSNDDGEGNENGKNTIGLDWQNSNFVRASLIFVHFFGVVARLQRETSYFHA